MSAPQSQMSVRRSGFQSPRAVLIDRILGILIFVTAVTVAPFALKGLPEIDYRQIPAPAYVWPAGCERAQYDVGDWISRSCTVDTAAIVYPERIGLTYNTPARAKHWFRIGDDALNLSCGWFFRECRVADAVRYKFVAQRRVSADRRSSSSDR